MQLNIETNGGMVTKTSMTTYLSMKIDGGLTWNDHIKKIKNRLIMEN